MGGLAIGAGVIFILLTTFLRKRPKPAFYCTLVFLIITALLTIFDDFGLIDLLYLVAVLVPLTLLLIDKKRYLQN